MNKITVMLFLFVIIALQSCTLIGLTLGLSADSAKRDRSILPGSYSSELDIGDKVTIVLSNSDTVSGQIVRFDTVRSNSTYSRFDIKRMVGLRNIIVPVQNDTISIDSASNFNQIFQGFTHSGIQITSLNPNKNENLTYSQFHTIYLRTGHKVESTDLEEIFTNNTWGRRIKFIVKSNGEEHSLDTIDIAHIKKNKQYYGWLVGTLIGTGLDLALIYIIESGISVGGGLNFGN